MANCLKCKCSSLCTTQVPLDLLVFCTQQNGLHLVLRPNLFQSISRDAYPQIRDRVAVLVPGLQAQDHPDEKKRKHSPGKVFCRSKEGVGNVVQVGPNNELVVALDSEFWSLCGQRANKKDKWKSVSPYNIQLIDSKDLAPSIKGKPRSDIPVQRLTPLAVEKLPDTVDLVHHTPRHYQWEVIGQCLLNPTNSLVCLPTGSGKTLIAAAYIAALHKVNSAVHQTNSSAAKSALAS